MTPEFICNHKVLDETMSNIGFCFHMVFENQIVYTEPTLYRCISLAYSKNQFQNKI